LVLAFSIGVKHSTVLSVLEAPRFAKFANFGVYFLHKMRWLVEDILQGRPKRLLIEYDQ